MAQEGSIEIIDRVEWPHDMPGSALRPFVDIRSNHELLGLSEPQRPVLIGNGYGENRWAEERALKRAAEDGVPAITAVPNIEQVPATTQDVIAYGAQYLPQVARYARQNFYSPNGVETGVDATAESMTGAFLAFALREAGEEFNGTIFCQPAGHDVPVLLRRFPDNDERRDDMLQRRFPRVVLRPYFATGENGFRGPRESTPGQYLRAVRDLALGQIVPDILKRRINPKFDSVVSPELVGTGAAVLDHAADGHKVGYITGGKDPLIIEANIFTSLILEATSGDIDKVASRVDALFARVEFVNVPNRRHAYMGFRGGLDNLSKALGMLGRTTNPVESAG